MWSSQIYSFAKSVKTFLASVFAIAFFSNAQVSSNFPFSFDKFMIQYDTNMSP